MEFPHPTIPIDSFQFFGFLEDSESNDTTNSTLTEQEKTTLLATKLSTLFGLLIGSFLVSLVPMVFARVKYFKKKINAGYISIIIDQCNGFAGGVLFSVGILHMMAEGGELISKGLKTIGTEKSAEYPIGPMTMCLAFLVLYFLEFVLLPFLSGWIKTQDNHHHHHHHGHHDHHHHETKAQNDTQTLTVKESSDSLAPPSTSTLQNCVDEIEMVKMKPQSPISNDEQHEVFPNLSEVDLESPEPKNTQPQPVEPTVCDQHHVHHEHGHDNGDHTGCAHHEATQMLFETNHKSGVPLILTAIILWLALSTHSIFIGLGFGAETNVSNMWSIFAAIVAHQFIEAFSLGSIVEKGCKNIIVAIALLLLYAASVPVGIAIGLIIVYKMRDGALEEDSWKVSQGVLLSVAAGAFLYVSLFEIAIHQPKNKFLKLSRFILMVFGFAAMAVIAIWA